MLCKWKAMDETHTCDAACVADYDLQAVHRAVMSRLAGESALERLMVVIHRAMQPVPLRHMSDATEQALDSRMRELKGYGWTMAHAAHDGRPPVVGIGRGVAVGGSSVRGSERWSATEMERFECVSYRVPLDTLSAVRSAAKEQGTVAGLGVKGEPFAPQRAAGSRKRAARVTVADERAVSLAARRRAVATLGVEAQGA
jgi:hypothetical protein